MAKFLNPGAFDLQKPLAAAAGAAQGQIGAPRIPIVKVEPVLLLYTVGCWAWALCTLAAQANDVMLHLMRGKAYLYYVGYPLALASFVFCGSALRGVGTTVGKLWLFFGLWLLVDLPFSVWRGGSWELLRSYLARDLILFFLICSFAVNLRYVKFLLHTAIVGALVVLLTCLVYGQEVEGRFSIPGSSYFGSANDLAIELMVNIGFFAFLLSKKRIVLRVLGALAIVVSVYLILRTASRGAFVASLVLLAVAFVITKNKMKMALLLIPVALTIPLVNRDALERLVMIYAKPESVKVESDQEGGAVVSQISRQRLLRMSLELTLKHPLFGVGPGQFVEATSGADQKRGRHSPALGTHNTYTQISSECGALAFFLFSGALFISLRKVWTLHKRTRDHAELRDIANMSYSLVLVNAGFCAVALFHHVGYTGYPFQLTGMAIALSLAAEASVAKLASQSRQPLMSGPAPYKPPAPGLSPR